MKAWQSDLAGAGATGESTHAPAAPGKSTLTQELAPAESPAAGEGPVAEDQLLAGDDTEGAGGGGGDGAVAEASKKSKPKGMDMSCVTISVKQAAKALSQRGSAEYKVHWSVGGKQNGWVIQHVKFTGKVKDHRNADVAITDEGLEYWEGWQVRDGDVFIGGGTRAHQTDTFRTANQPKKTKGHVEIIGKVAFVEDYKLKTPPWGHSVAAAGALPTVTSAPEGWSDGNAQSHTLKVRYDDIAKTKQTQDGSP